MTIFSVNFLIFSYPSILTYVLGDQKNRLNEKVLLSTHNICFGREIRKLIFIYALFTKDLGEWKRIYICDYSVKYIGQANRNFCT